MYTSTAWGCDGSEPPEERVPQPLTTERALSAGSMDAREIG